MSNKRWIWILHTTTFLLTLWLCPQEVQCHKAILTISFLTNAWSKAGISCHFPSSQNLQQSLFSLQCNIPCIYVLHERKIKRNVNATAIRRAHATNKAHTHKQKESRSQIITKFTNVAISCNHTAYSIQVTKYIQEQWQWLWKQSREHIASRCFILDNSEQCITLLCDQCNATPPPKYGHST